MKRTVLKFAADTDGWETLYKREEVTTVETLDEFKQYQKDVEIVCKAAECWARELDRTVLQGGRGVLLRERIARLIAHAKTKGA